MNTFDETPDSSIDDSSCYNEGMSRFSDSGISFSESPDYQNHSFVDSTSPIEFGSDYAYTVECPKCKYRFCSNCQECEHPKRRCRMLSSDDLDSCGSGSFPRTKHKKKSTLRRIARL